MNITIRPYRPSDERSWLRCSVLAFLETAYFDSVFREKPRYEYPTVELVADRAGEIVGLIDVEYEEEPGQVCSPVPEDDPSPLGAMIWHLAVHPDYQRRGIGGRLLWAAQEAVQPRGVAFFEAWTRDDPPTLAWYRRHGFHWVSSYLHVYPEGKEEVGRAVQPAIPGLKPVHMFAHYTSDDREAIRTQFRRVHECSMFRLSF